MSRGKVFRFAIGTCALLLGLGSIAQAALIVPTGTTSNPRTGYTIGYEFTVGTAPITLNALGVEDDNASGSGYGDGLSNTHVVGIWSSAGTLLYSATVSSGTSAPLVNDFRYALLNSAVTLNANTSYYIGTYFASGGDTFYDVSGLFNAGSGISLTNGQGTYGNGGSLTNPLVPNTAGGGASNRWAGANANMFNYVWTGSSGTAWDTSTTNWTNGFSGAAATYSNSSVLGVQFDDTAGTNTTVNLSAANVTPVAVTFNNNTQNYTLQGSYGIAGTASLAMTGTGVLTISNSNGYTGGTILSAGVLAINNSGALGSGALTINGGSLDSSAAGITLAGNGQNWNASFGFRGTQSLNLGSGTVALANSPTVNIGQDTLTVGGNISGASGLTVAGNGTLLLTSTNAYTGNTTVSGGTLQLAAGGSINNAAQLVVSGTGSPAFNLNGGTLISSLNSGNVFDVGTTSTAQTGVINISSGSISLTGASVNSVTLGDAGNGVWNQSGGTVSLAGGYWQANSVSTTATTNLSGGA